MSEMVRCRHCGATFPYEPPSRAQASPGPAMLEFMAKRRELQLKELEAGQGQGAQGQAVASSGDPEIPRLMGTWIQGDEDIARSLAERKPSAPASEEEIAPPKKRVRDRAHHAQYMRGWRARQYLRKYGIPA